MRTVLLVLGIVVVGVADGRASDECGGPGKCKYPCSWQNGACRPGDDIFLHPIKPGDEGAHVEALQERLNEEGYSVNVDGEFGRETSEAVKSFQEDEGLAITGKVNAETDKRLRYKGF
jgi:peptidoglycan hydrolase-like protein with peptidoglycan-binding domain